MNSPIGIFDSGLGGLTVVRQVHKLLANESIIYFGDTGRVPYGTRSNETIEKYAKQDIEFLQKHNVKMIIAACGTVSSVVPNAGEGLDVPYTGVVIPSARAAASATKNGKIGAIGTSATIASHAYKKNINILNPELSVYECACPLFVPIVENGMADDIDIVLPAAKKYLLPFAEKGIDTLILGCTHYPLLKDVIRQILGDGVTLIDSGEQTAFETAKLLKEHNILSDEKKSDDEFYVSDAVQGFSEIASLFLGLDISDKTFRANI